MKYMKPRVWITQVYITNEHALKAFLEGKLKRGKVLDDELILKLFESVEKLFKKRLMPHPKLMGNYNASR